MKLISKKPLPSTDNSRNSPEQIYCMGHYTSGIHSAELDPLCLNGHPQIGAILSWDERKTEIELTPEKEKSISRIHCYNWLTGQVTVTC